MNITFDLKEAVVYLPSGKVMNLKSKLNWDSLEMTPEQIQEALKPVEQENFKMNFNFDKLENDLAQEFMSEQAYKRVELYKEITTKKFDKLDYLKNSENSLTSHGLELFEQIGDIIMNDKRVIEKIQKLDRLKLINS